MNSAKKAIEQGSKSFALAALFLPKENRQNAYLLYQWCRTCDDLIDDSENPIAALERLPEIQAPPWVNPMHREEFLAGFRMDVEGHRYQSFSDLELYCYRVAGVVGLMMCPVLGADAKHAPPFAATLGMAMQLTNIARDIQEDARIGRVYLPESLIGQIKADTLATTLATTPEIALSAVKEILKTADAWYDTGFQGLAWLPLRTSFAIALAGLVYQKIGHKLLESAKEDSRNSFRRRTVVSPFEKSLAFFPALWLVLKIKLLRLGFQERSFFPELLQVKMHSSRAHER